MRALSSVPLGSLSTVQLACPKDDPFHGDAIADGSITGWELLVTETICGTVYETFRCPRCKSTVSRRVAPALQVVAQVDGVYRWHADPAGGELGVDHRGDVWHRAGVTVRRLWTEREVKRAMRVMDGEPVRTVAA